MSKNFIDELMDVTPEVVQTLFAEPTQTTTANPLLYKTNPSLANTDVSSDGFYRSKIRIIYNPFNKMKSIVSKQTYSFNDCDGFFMVDSVLSLGDKNCPFFKGWKSLHYDTNPEIVINYNGKQLTRSEWGDTVFEKRETRWCLIQVIEDQNQPQLVGKILAMKLPSHILTNITSKMNPTDKSKTPVDIMNYLFGPVLNMEVQPGPDDPAHPERRNREISYNLCSFDESEPTPVINTDGTQMFNEDELEAIMDYFQNKKVMTNSKSSAKKKEEAKQKCEELVETIKPLMQKALDYIKANAFDIEAEFGYKKPTDAEMQRAMEWLKAVQEFKDPKIVFNQGLTAQFDNNFGILNTSSQQAPASAFTPAASVTVDDNTTDDLPF